MFGNVRGAAVSYMYCSRISSFSIHALNTMYIGDELVQQDLLIRCLNESKGIAGASPMARAQQATSHRRPAFTTCSRIRHSHYKYTHMY